MLYDVVVQHTLARGGGTFYLDGRPVQVGKGYAVGGFVPARTVPLEKFDALTIDQFVTTHSGKLHEPGLYLGTWLHDGVVYLDVSAIVPSRSVALAAGRGLSQVAVYDFSTRNDLAI